MSRRAETSSQTEDHAGQVGQDLWERAFATLTTEDRQQYDDCSWQMLDVLEEVTKSRKHYKACRNKLTQLITKLRASTEAQKQACISNGWRSYRYKHGEEVKLRHVLEKVHVWVDGFIKIVDPGIKATQNWQVALPWALVKYLMMVGKAFRYKSMLRHDSQDPRRSSCLARSPRVSNSSQVS